MKKYLIMSSLFLLIAIPALAKGPDEAQGQQSPTGNQAKNQKVGDSLPKVSDYAHQLIEERQETGIKSGIGQQVSEFAQNQIKLQDEIKSDVDQLNSRGKVSKFFIGSDKKLIKIVEQKMEQNLLMIQQLEQLKLQTKNSSELQQLQATITLVTNQNTSLKNKINTENKVNGIFGWLINLFN